MSRKSPDHGDETSWGDALAGALTLAVAAVIQITCGEVNPDALRELQFPTSVATSYAATGKLALTLPLTGLSLYLIARESFAGAGRRRARPASVPAAASQQSAGELELGGLLAEESETPQGQDGPMVLSSAKYLKRKHFE